ncbi:MAG TPA: hypothetical protein VGD88_00125 [Opitutaceae bacterium]
MKKLTSLLSFSLSVIATVLLILGFGAVAAKVDPVVVKAKTITTADAGQVASLPCMSCTGGDPVDRVSGVEDFA